MKHDESTDVKRLSFVGVRTAITPTTTGTVKCLIISPDLRTRLGIKQWGRIDYLTKYCKYRIVSNIPSSGAVITKAKSISAEEPTDKKNVRQAKKEKKAPKLTNKKKK